MRRPILLIVSILLFCLSLGQLFYGLSRHISSPFVDFEVYYRAGRYFLYGLNPYSANFPPMPLNYPPSSLPFFALWSLIPYNFAQLFFTVASYFLFLSAAFLLMRQLKLKRWLILVILAFLTQSFPLKFTLVLGQVNLLILVLLIFAFLLHQKKHPLTGFFWGLASGIKLSPLSLGIYFLYKKDWLTLTTGFFTFIFLNLASIYLIPGTFAYFTDRLPQLLTLSQSTDSYYNQSLKIFLQRLYLPYPGLLAIFIIGIMLFLGIRNYRLKRKLSGNKDTRLLNDLFFCSRLLILSIIAQSVAWQHQFVLTFPAAIAASIHVYRTKNVPLSLLTLLSALLLGMHFPDLSRPWTANPLLFSHTTLGSILLFLILTFKL